MLHHCFAPQVRPDTRLLILGSLPGAMSLAAGRYYAHPRNQFWRLMEQVIHTPLKEADYEARIERLLNAGVGLWDTVAAAHRSGSLDADIKLEEASDVSALAATLPELRAVAFNGGTAARIGRKQLRGINRYTLIDLPSSSPAFTRSFTQKQARWGQLAAYLRA